MQVLELCKRARECLDVSCALAQCVIGYQPSTHRCSMHSDLVTLSDTDVAHLQMLMDLGPIVYVEDFEKHFLAKAAEFYQVRSVVTA